VVSPFGVGLALVTGEALLSRAPSRFERFRALTHTVASCRGSVSFLQRFAFTSDVPVSDGASTLAYLLSPGRHMVVDDPSSSSHCGDPRGTFNAKAEVPTERDVDWPLVDDVWGARLPALPPVRGNRIGSSRARGLAYFSRCVARSTSFRSCDAETQNKTPVDVARALSLANVATPAPPTGLEALVDAAVVEKDGLTFIAVSLDTLADPHHRVSRPQSLVMVMPVAGCNGSLPAFEASLLTRIRDASSAPRNEHVGLRIPVLHVEMPLLVATSAPLDGLTTRTAMYTYPCPSFEQPRIGKELRVIDVKSRFVFALVDDQTRAIRLVGQHTRLSVPDAP
jgi:hypothetical protein